MSQNHVREDRSAGTSPPVMDTFLVCSACTKGWVPSSSFPITSCDCGGTLSPMNRTEWLSAIAAQSDLDDAALLAIEQTERTAR